MLNKISIKNYKSIKELTFDCKKLNVFIGEPNSGKSNIIEALALKSQNALDGFLNHSIFRYKTIGELFFDFNINSPIQVISDNSTTEISYGKRDNIPEHQFRFYLNKKLENNKHVFISHDGKVSQNLFEETNVHFYEFKRLDHFALGYTPHLSVPFGDNLPGLLLSNPEYKKWVSEFMHEKGFTLTLKPTENDLAVSKFIDGEIYSYPYFNISETLQRVIFYSIAVKSNNNAVLLFDEPETNTFPFYTKYIAEMIALDESNQFFITTHNPYLLLNLIEKTPIDSLNVGLVRMENYCTKVDILSKDQISQVLDFNSDVFFNFDKLVD